jgi:hypothetical protein
LGTFTFAFAFTSNKYVFGKGCLFTVVLKL